MLDNIELITRPRAGDISFKCMPYELLTGYDMPPVVVMGNGELGFGSGEGATTSYHDHSPKRVPCPIIEVDKVLVIYHEKIPSVEVHIPLLEHIPDHLFLTQVTVTFVSIKL